MNKILKLFVGGVIAVSAVPVCVADDAVDVDVSDTTVSDVTPVKTANVTARMDCKTLKAKIDELSLAGPSDELSQYKTQYRQDCAVRVSGLRSSYRGGALSIASASSNLAQAVAVAPVADEKKEPVPVPDAEQPAAVTNSDDVAVPQTEPVEISDEQKDMCARLPDAIGVATDDTRDTLQSTFDEYCNADVVAPDAVIKTTMIVLGPAETDEERYARMAENLDAGLCADGTKPNKYGCCGDEVFKDLGNLEFACCPKDGGDCFPPVK